MSVTISGRPARAIAIVSTVLAMLAVACSGGSPGERAQVARDRTERRPFGEPDEGSRVGTGPAQELYDSQAYPRAYISHGRVLGALKAARAVPSASSVKGALARASSWTELGPTTGVVPDVVTYTGRETTNSGRVTAMAIGPTCTIGSCRLWVGAAGGGVWRTTNALASAPTWKPVSTGLTSNAIGSIVVDPNDPTGKTLYVGTGEPNGSGDSEAGVGLFRSSNGGTSWSLVPGSVAVSKDRSIGSIAIDPTNPNHYYIGTDVARHGSSSANGGRRTPPNAPALGLYETTDGGASFNLIFSMPANPNPPSTGVDWFQGGVNSVQLDPNDPASVYAALFGYGLWRRSPSLDGDSQFHQVFATANPTDTFGDRTEFSLVDLGAETRIYLGDSSDDAGYSVLWRTDDASVPAATLFGGGSNAGWVLLSSATNGTAGFGTYGFCQFQCGYDMFVVSPPGQPDTVWLGGAMNYDELAGGALPMRSNGRAVVRSTDAGVSVTDMTNDALSPPTGMHPDQHTIVFDPANPNIAFVGSDGGVVRTSETYVNGSGVCGTRKLRNVDMADCTAWLSAVPSSIASLNAGLGTIQFQSLSVNPQNPLGDILGGTQDNGTFAFTGSPTWIESVGGDGGQSGTDVANANIRYHNYFDATPDVNFHGTDKMGWDWIGDPLAQSHENQSFYAPFITDPRTSGTAFTGLQHVWRTTDSGGDQAFLDASCNELTGTFAKPCGDWQALGGQQTGDLTSTVYGDRAGQYVVATERAPSDTGTMWAATRIGRVFVSSNVDAPAANSVTWTRVDSDPTPGRFVSGIAIDPADPDHAWVSFSGYDAYTPATPGHVFEVRFDPATGTATWTDRSDNLGDQPITDVVYDDVTGDLYASTDFGVLRLPAGGSVWTVAAPGLPPVATYGLTIVPSARVLYAATHGRGAWKLALP